MEQLGLSLDVKKSRKSKYGEEVVSLWADLYRSGKSYREIADQVNVPYPTVFWWIRKKLKISDGRKTGRKKQFETTADQRKAAWLRTEYGLSWDAYLAMVAAQCGLCAICSKSRGRRPLHVDHDHVTGKVRALLCYKCNSGIGNLNDDPNLMEKAAAYLRQHGK